MVFWKKVIEFVFVIGRLTIEIESRVADYFEKNRNGILMNISEWEEANRVSGLIGAFCDECRQCLASSPVISLGEIEKSLRNSGLFASGWWGIKDKRKCAVVENNDDRKY